MKTYIVQLENHDDIISARDKISWSKARRVLLIWPRRGKVLERRVDLLLLARYAQQTGAQLALVTADGQVKDHARALGIPVFRSAIDAQKKAWRTRAGSYLRRKAAWDLRVPTDPQVLREQREQLSRRPAENRLLRVGMFGLGVLAFLALALFFTPSAEVELSLAQIPQELTIPVWASPAIRAPNPSGGLPARVVTVVVEGRDQIDSTGTAQAPEGTAEGQVQLTNLTDQVVNVPQGSIVLTTGTPPARFIVTKAIQVPAGPGESILAPVRAAAPGRSGNVAAGQIRSMEGPVGLRLLVENLDPTRGGSSRLVPAPSQADYRALREKLLAELEQTALDEIDAGLEPGEQVLVESLRLRGVLEEHRDPPAGQPADLLQLILRGEYEAWIIAEDDLRAVVQPALEAMRPDDLRPAPGSLRLEFASRPEWADDGPAREMLRWQVRVGQSLQPSWDVDDLRLAIRGLAVDDAKRVLQSRLLLNEPPQIHLRPAWWRRMPILPFRMALVQK